jgi:hypothetical protein
VPPLSCVNQKQVNSAAGTSGANVLWRQALADQPAPWGDGSDASARGLQFIRLVFLDSSQRSLASSDPGQDPVEPGGQQAWLQTMLCTTQAAGCSRAPGEQAIVVSNAPTYSYGPGVANGTATDATQVETTLVQNHANLFVSGRIGWNALYYTLAPGVHYPCPAGAYPPGPPGGTADLRD